MKSFITIMALAGSFCLNTAAIAQQTTSSTDTAAVSDTTTKELRLSLDKCIEIALSKNPTIQVADMEITRMDYSKKEVLAQLLPNISFGTTYNRMLAKQVAYMNMDGMPGLGGGSGSGSEGSESGDEAPRSSRSSKKMNGIKMGLDNSWSTGFQASVPLFMPQLWQSMKLSDSQILQTVETARNSRLEMVNSVKGAYYALLLAQDSRKVIEESYDMARLTYETYTKNEKAGAASKYDVLRASVAMKNIEPQLIQAEIAIKQARLQLLILMGMDASYIVNADSDLEYFERNMSPRTTPSTASEVENNPSLRLNAVQLQIADRNVKLQKWAFAPTLSASINYNWTSSSNGNPFRNFRWTGYSMFGLNLSFPLFEGGGRYSKLKQAKIQSREARLERENLYRSVNSQIDLAIDNINLNVKQIESCIESEHQADEAHIIMKKSFDVGAASYLDLRDSELALTQARLSRLQAVYNYLVADAGLELLLGSAPLEKYGVTDSRKSSR